MKTLHFFLIFSGVLRTAAKNRKKCLMKTWHFFRFLAACAACSDVTFARTSPQKSNFLALPIAKRTRVVRRFRSTPKNRSLTTLEDTKNRYFWIRPTYFCGSIQNFLGILDTFGYAPPISKGPSTIPGGRSPP